MGEGVSLRPRGWDCRLLAACNLTYDIVAAPSSERTVHGLFRAFAGDEKAHILHRRYHAEAGLRDPQMFVGGANHIDAVLMDVIGDDIILAFRGTLPPGEAGVDPWVIATDWLNDADCDLIERPPYLPGHVHHGFSNSLLGDGDYPGLWAELAPRLEAFRGSGKRVYLTGHSKGGALANIAAVLCAHIFPKPDIYVATFAAPRPGNQNFKDGYDRLVGQCRRYEYYLDIVPHLPPEQWVVEGIGSFFDMQVTEGYVAVGDRVAIGSDYGGTILQAAIAVELGACVFKKDFSPFGVYHNSHFGSFYANEVKLLLEEIVESLEPEPA